MAPGADTLSALRRGDLAGTSELRLTGCGLTELPEEVFGLAETLEVLDLSGNTLTALPDGMARLAKLRALFCSGNRFVRLPPVLGDCPSLSQIGFRGGGLTEVPGEALPPSLRWLTLTDNRIEHLPSALGERPLLQKLMLAGNRLRRLPDGMAGAANLELLRLASNGFEALPGWLAALPRLAWIAWGANPVEPAMPPAAAQSVPWARLDVAELLGEGASGRVHRALWHPESGAARPVALKLFKGAMTSDGLPEREMAACLSAGAHPNLTSGLGRVEGHPAGAEALVMPLLPAGWRVLAGPPSLATCSRDVYDPGLYLEPAAALALARSAAAGAAHLHARHLLHGDLYGHNILWDGSSGQAVLSDFGAACVLPGEGGTAWQRIEVRAWGILLGELLDRCIADPPDARGLRELERACLQPDPAGRPLMADVLDALSRHGGTTSGSGARGGTRTPTPCGPGF